MATEIKLDASFDPKTPLHIWKRFWILFWIAVAWGALTWFSFRSAFTLLLLFFTFWILARLFKGELKIFREFLGVIVTIGTSVIGAIALRFLIAQVFQVYPIDSWNDLGKRGGAWRTFWGYEAHQIALELIIVGFIAFLVFTWKKSWITKGIGTVFALFLVFAVVFNGWAKTLPDQRTAGDQYLQNHFVFKGEESAASIKTEIKKVVGSSSSGKDTSISNRCDDADSTIDIPNTVDGGTIAMKEDCYGKIIRVSFPQSCIRPATEKDRNDPDWDISFLPIIFDVNGQREGNPTPLYTAEQHYEQHYQTFRIMGHGSVRIYPGTCY